VSSGYVYVLSNESMPGYVKVGRSIHGGATRGRALFQTGVATPFVLEFEIFTKDHEWLESKVHMNLKFSRVNPDREFFKCPPSDAIEEIVGIYMERLCRSVATSAVVEPIPEAIPSPEEVAEAKAQAEIDRARVKEKLKQLRDLMEWNDPVRG
jgi:hypothetical protein